MGRSLKLRPEYPFTGVSGPSGPESPKKTQNEWGSAKESKNMPENQESPSKPNQRKAGSRIWGVFVSSECFSWKNNENSRKQKPKKDSKIREMPPGLLLQHVLVVLVFSGPGFCSCPGFHLGLGPSDCSPGLAFCFFHGPLDIAWICSPQLPPTTRAKTGRTAHVFRAQGGTRRNKGWGSVKRSRYARQTHKNFWMRLFCVQLEASCLQWSFFTYS